MIAEIAGVSIVKVHVAGPQGVRGRNSDNSRLREVLGWEPGVSLEEGLARTYAWIEDAMRLAGAKARRESQIAAAHAEPSRSGAQERAVIAGSLPAGLSTGGASAPDALRRADASHAPR